MLLYIVLSELFTFYTHFQADTWQDTVPVIIIETKVPVELALFLQSTMASIWKFPCGSHS